MDDLTRCTEKSASGFQCRNYAPYYLIIKGEKEPRCFCGTHIKHLRKKGKSFKRENGMKFMGP